MSLCHGFPHACRVSGRFSFICCSGSVITVTRKNRNDSVCHLFSPGSLMGTLALPAHSPPSRTASDNLSYVHDAESGERSEGVRVEGWVVESGRSGKVKEEEWRGRQGFPGAETGFQRPCCWLCDPFMLERYKRECE